MDPKTIETLSTYLTPEQRKDRREGRAGRVGVLLRRLKRKAAHIRTEHDDARIAAAEAKRARKRGRA